MVVSAPVSGGEWPRAYEVRVEGVLEAHAAASWFDGLNIRSEGSQTIITGLVIDQPALHGLLLMVRDLGLTLISVRAFDTNEVAEGEQ
jgi:hypothetical protein